MDGRMEDGGWRNQALSNITRNLIPLLSDENKPHGVSTPAQPAQPGMHANILTIRHLHAFIHHHYLTKKSHHNPSAPLLSLALPFPFPFALLLSPKLCNLSPIKYTSSRIFLLHPVKALPNKNTNAPANAIARTPG